MRLPFATGFVGLLLVACGSRHTDSSLAPDLPDECTAFLADYGRCLGAGQSPGGELAEARIAQTRASFLAQATRGPEALLELRTKCVSARERLSVTCR